MLAVSMQYVRQSCHVGLTTAAVRNSTPATSPSVSRVRMHCRKQKRLTGSFVNDFLESPHSEGSTAPAGTNNATQAANAGNIAGKRCSLECGRGWEECHWDAAASVAARTEVAARVAIESIDRSSFGATAPM